MANYLDIRALSIICGDLIFCNFEVVMNYPVIQMKAYKQCFQVYCIFTIFVAGEVVAHPVIEFLYCVTFFEFPT